jgi:hypothetical protein
MQTALKGLPVTEVPPVEGVVPVGGDWRYQEWANEGFVHSIGLDPGQGQGQGQTSPGSVYQN